MAANRAESMQQGLKRFAKGIGLVALILRAWQIVAMLYRPAAVRRYLRTYPTRKLHLGAGIRALDGWLNTDLWPHPKHRQIVFLDARKRFPFADGVFDYVFSEHLIEYLTYREGCQMLRECYRVLRHGGKIRIASPDLDALVALRNPTKTDVQRRYIAWAVETHIPDAGVPEDVFVINNFFRAWGHRFIYDRETLANALTRAGFIGIVVRRVGESDDEPLRGLESHGREMPAEFNALETLILEGTKPA